MDPFSVSANIITVLQATISIISLCYDFRAALKSAPWSLTRILDEITDLRSLLENLERLSEGLCRREPQELKRRSSFELLCDSEKGPLASCLRELAFLQNTLSFPSAFGKCGTKRYALLQAVGWRLKDQDAKSCLERIDRCKSTLSLAITADEATLLLELQSMAAALDESVQAVDSKLTSCITKMYVTEMNEKQKSMLKWLSSEDSSESHETAAHIHQKGTSSWLLQSEELSSWLSEDNSSLWLSGFPGAGKTVLFSTIVSHIGSLFGASTVAYFYCDFRRAGSRDPVSVVGSLVAQLCAQTTYFPEELEHAFEYSNSGCQRKKPALPVLKFALQKLSKTRKTIVLIDALDECDKRNDILGFISDVDKSARGIKFLITSRDEPDFQENFRKFRRLRTESHQEDMDLDIRRYIGARLNSDRGLQRLNSCIKADVARILNNESAGMFRWAQCQLDSISTLRTVKAIRTKLEELPQGLNETYGNILRNISKGDTELARRILLWVSFAVLPLTIEDLHEAIAIEHGMEHLDEESRLSNPQDILSLCGSLINISDQGHVRLAHLSVKDYLLSQDIRNDESVSTFAMSPSNANQELAINCVTYLSYTSLTSGPTPTADLFVSRLAQQPLLRHASTAWPYYVRASPSKPSSILQSHILRFFSPPCRPKFLSWVQVLNADHAFKWDLYPRHATPLYYASSFGLTATVDALLSSSSSQPINSHPDLNAPGSRFGGTPLHGAVLRFHVPVMRALLAAGAEGSRADYNGVSPLHTAAAHGNEEVIRLLLEYGADVKAVDKGGETPTDWARKAGQEEVLEMLMGSEQEGETMAEEQESIAVAAPAGVCDARQKNKTRQEEVWKRVVPYFPSFYDKRSGLESSIVVSVEIGSARFDLV